MTLDSFFARELFPFHKHKVIWLYEVPFRITQSAARQEEDFKIQDGSLHEQATKIPRLFAKNHYCMLALRKKIFVYAVISICIITITMSLFIRADSIITIYDQRNVPPGPCRNAISQKGDESA